MTLRSALLVLSGAALIVALVEIFSGSTTGWIALAVYAALIIAGLTLERPRYRRRVDRSDPAWRPTGERFTDPASGEAIVVYERPQTGERDYRREA